MLGQIFKQRAMQLPPNELQELDQLLDQNPRLTGLLLKMFPEMAAIMEPPGEARDSDDSGLGAVPGAIPMPGPGPAPVQSDSPQISPGAGLHGARVY